MKLPPEYQQVERGRAEAFAYAPVAEWLSTLLEEGRSLHEWAAERDDAKPLVGRGPMYAVSAPTAGPDDRPRWAVRHYLRGGLVAPLLKDKYLCLGPPRPHRELWLTAEARARGLPVPAVVAGAVYVAGPLYRADLVTELVPSARTLAALVFTGGPEVDRLPLLRAAGELTAKLREARFYHTDLNAKNVLIVRRGDDVEAHVVDLDGCRALPLDGPLPSRFMRRRLERSLRKLAGEYGRPVTDEEWEALRSGYTDPS